MGVENLSQSVPNVQLEKARLTWAGTYAELDRAPAEQQFQVLYNPTEYAIDVENQVSETAIPGLRAPVMQFVSGRGRTLSMQLFIDTTEPQPLGGSLEGDASQFVAKVTDLLQPLPKTGAPPLCRLTWGKSLSFDGVLLSAKVRYLLFGYSGKPLRATVDISVREYRPISVQLSETKGDGPQQTRVRQIKQGETLSLLAAQEYGDASKWRLIADANNISDPRRVKAGTQLKLPPLPKQEAQR
jgi:nucleoid-associated protein YgaU